MRKFLKRFFLLVVCAQTTAVSADTAVYFAGLAYIGDASDMARAAPYAASLIQDSKALTEYNGQLVAAMRDASVEDVRLETLSGRSTSGEALSLALAITEEQFQAEDTGSGYYAVKATTFGQIVLFDFTEKRVISTVPFITSYTDSPEEVDEAYKRQIYETVYFDRSKKINIVNVFAARLSDVNFEKPFNSWNIRVRTVEQTAKADGYLATYGVDKDVFHTRLASQFSASMSQGLRIPVLPFTKGQAIGGAMALRFADAEALQLELPPADYYVDLKLLGFNKKIMKQTDQMIYPSYIAGLRVSIGDAGFDELLFSEKAQSGRVLKLSRNLDVNEWNEYKNSLTALSDEFCKQLAKPEKKWFKEKMFSKKSFKQMKKITKNLEQDIFDQLR
jgi:hypothetical protein